MTHLVCTRVPGISLSPSVKGHAMRDSQPRFAIIHAPGQQAEPIVLRGALPAEAASVAFTSELQRLQQAGAAGELLMYGLDTNQVVLRQRLTRRGTVDDRESVAPSPLSGAA